MRLAREESRGMRLREDVFLLPVVNLRINCWRQSMATVNCFLRREMSRSRQIMQRMILIDQLVGKWIGSRLQRAEILLKD
jgi:hypothetical protein